MNVFHSPSARRRAWLASAAWLALALPAYAGDAPATAAGAASLAGVFKTYFGSQPTVTPQGAGYSVSFPFAPPAGVAGGKDVKFDPVKIDLMLYMQDDGAWRIEQKDLPAFSFSSKMDKGEVKETVAYTGFKQTSVWDPAIAGVRSGNFSADKIAVTATLPDDGQEDVAVAGWKGTIAGAAGADGALSTTVKQSVDSFDIKLLVDPKEKDGKPFAMTGKAGASTGDGKVDGLKSKALLDLWAFMVAHPQRADLAANEAAFKALLTTLASSQPSGAESFQMQQASFSTAQGGVSFDKGTVGLSTAAKGPQSQFEEHFALSGISLPDGLVPPMYKAFVPSSADIGVKLSGFDLNAAGAEAIADMKLAGDAPWLDQDGKDKVLAKLMGAGPLIIELPTSHVVAPNIDLTVDARAEYRAGGKPVGKATLRLRNFDKTVAGLHALGTEMESKAAPMLAMAKGLAKADGDALVWVCEIGADRVIKVNGLPLGKSPF